MREIKIESIRSVDRSIDILNAFTLEKPNLTIDQIMKLVQLPRATVYRLLYTMERRGLIRYNSATHYYRLGFKMLEYGHQVTLSLDVVKEAEDLLTDLHLKTNETVLMAVIEEYELVYVYKKEKLTGLKYASSVGERRPLTYGAIGRTAMAFLPDDKIDLILEEEIPKMTPHTITDRQMIKDQLAEIRINRLYMEQNQTNLGVTALSSPVFGADGNILASVGLLFPTANMDEPGLQNAKEMLCFATEQISIRLGYKPTF